MERKVNILIVEDEVVTAMLMQMQLKNNGYFLPHYVTTGENAIISVKQEHPDVLLMDIRLAGNIDGIETADIIQSISPDIKTIFLTGYVDQKIRGKAETIKPLAFLIKPLDMKLFNEIIIGHFK
jgi:two-component system, response regulator PdtaR